MEHDGKYLDGQGTEQFWAKVKSLTQSATEALSALVDGVRAWTSENFYTKAQEDSAHAAKLNKDGSNATRSGTSVIINTLEEGTATPQDSDRYVCNYVGNQNVWIRRTHLALWEYIKAKIASALGLTATAYNGTADKAKADQDGTNIKTSYVRRGDMHTPPTASLDFTSTPDADAFGRLFTVRLNTSENFQTRMRITTGIAYVNKFSATYDLRIRHNSATDNLVDLKMLTLSEDVAGGTPCYAYAVSWLEGGYMYAALCVKAGRYNSIYCKLLDNNGYFSYNDYHDRITINQDVGWTDPPGSVRTYASVSLKAKGSATLDAFVTRGGNASQFVMGDGSLSYGQGKTFLTITDDNASTYIMWNTEVLGRDGTPLTGSFIVLDRRYDIVVVQTTVKQLIVGIKPSSSSAGLTDGYRVTLIGNRIGNRRDMLILAEGTDYDGMDYTFSYYIKQHFNYHTESEQGMYDFLLWNKRWYSKAY